MPRRYIFLLFALIAFGFMVSAQDATQTPYPTATPTVTPMPNLLIRHPSLEQIESYLLYYYLPVAHEYFRGFRWWSENESMLYADVNGDNEEDLIANGQLFVAVMLWQGEKYGEPLIVWSPASTRNPWSKVSLEDWTLDNIPEIIFDGRSSYAGTGIGGHFYKRHIIHCQQDCSVVWKDTTADYYWQFGTGVGMRLYQAELAVIQVGEDVILENVSTNLVITCSIIYCPLPEDTEPNDLQVQSIVGASIQTRYLWTGSSFEELDSTVISEPYIIESVTRLEAARNDGTHAQIVTGLRFEMYREGGCQLLVNGYVVSAIFGCTEQYLSVEWRNVVPIDGDELVLKWIYGNEQHLVIYQQLETDFIELANFTGAIFQADMFGVRLEDIDNDGQYEIVSAGSRFNYFDADPCYGMYCWYELNDQNDIYKWNGEGFEYAYSVPREE